MLKYQQNSHWFTFYTHPVQDCLYNKITTIQLHVAHEMCDRQWNRAILMSVMQVYIHIVETYDFPCDLPCVAPPADQPTSEA